MKFSTTTTSSRRLGYSKGFFLRALIISIFAFAITSTAVLSEDATSAPPSSPPTDAPTEEPPPTEIQATTAALTEAPKIAAPTEAPKTAAPTEAPKTAAPTEAPKTAAPTEAPNTHAPGPSPTIKSSSSSKSGSGPSERSPSPSTTSQPTQETQAAIPTPTTTTNAADTTNHTPFKPKETSSSPGATTDAQDGSKSGSNENSVVLFVMGSIGAVCVIGLLMMFVLRRRSKNNREDESETPLPYRSSSFQMEPRDGYAAYSTAAKAANPVQGHNPQGPTSPSISKGAIGLRNSAVLLDKITRSSSLSQRLSSSSILFDTRTVHRFGRSDSIASGQFSQRSGSEVSELTGMSSMTYLDRPSIFSEDSPLSLDSTSTYNHGGNGMENRSSTPSFLTDHNTIDFGTNSVSFINTEHSQPLEFPDLSTTADDRESYAI